jgi:hypothetical protein
MDPRTRAEWIRRGLLTYPAGQALGGAWEGAKGLGSAAAFPFKAAFTGFPEYGQIPEETVGEIRGAYDPSTGFDMEKALAFQPRESRFPAEEGGAGVWDIGKLPEMVYPKDWQGVQAPSFQAAFDRMGAEPTEPGGRPQMENLARLLGGAASGAAQGLTPEAARAGASTAMTLAGAGAGAGAVVSQISREDQVRQREFRMRLDRYRGRMAELEAAQIKAKSDTERFNKAGQMHQENLKFQAELTDMQRRAPKVHVSANGLVSVESVKPDGTVQLQRFDFLEDYRYATLMAKQQAAAARDTVWMGGMNYLPTSAFEPYQLQLINQAQMNLAVGPPEFKRMVFEKMEADADGTDIETLIAQSMSGIGIEYDDLQLMMIMAAYELMGGAAADFAGGPGEAVRGEPGLPPETFMGPLR